MEPEPELEPGAQAADAAATTVLRVAVTMGVPVASVDQRADLNHRDRTKEALLALHQLCQGLASSFLECHQRNLVDWFVEGGEMCL